MIYDLTVIAIVKVSHLKTTVKVMKEK